MNSGIEELLDTLRQKWLGEFNRRPNVERQQQFIDCLRIILLNLVRARVQAEGMTVGIASGKGRLNTEKRYNPNFMSVTYFTTALSLLASEGIMTVVTPGYQYGTLAQVARYALTDSGVARLPIKDITRGEFAPGTPREVIILRDRDKRLCDYRDTQNTVAMRDALTLINTILDNADISTTRQMGVEAEVGGTTTTRNDHTVHWAIAHLRRKPPSRWTKGQSCTNFQIGPLKWGCSGQSLGSPNTLLMYNKCTTKIWDSAGRGGTLGDQS